MEINSDGFVRVLCINDAYPYKEGATYLATPHGGGMGEGWFSVKCGNGSASSFNILYGNPEFAIDPEQDLEIEKYEKLHFKSNQGNLAGGMPKEGSV